MRRFMFLLILLPFLSGPLLAGPQDPFIGIRTGPDQVWRYVVADTLIGTGWERVVADTGFTQIASGDTVIRFAFASQSTYDSITVGNDGSGSLIGAWALGSTADASANNNFFEDELADGTVAFKAAAAVFTTGASPRHGAHLVRMEDTDFRKGSGSLGGPAGWTQVVWARGLSPGNPGIGEPQLVFSTYESPDIVQVGIDDRGYAFLRVSDDGRATWDSIGQATDIYDSLYHRIEWGARASNIYLKVDRNARVTTAFSNATTTLTIDTLALFEFRGGNFFRGHLDEAWDVEDTTTVDSTMALYSYLNGRRALGYSTDSTFVRGYGLKRDSTYAVFSDTVWPGGTGTSASDFLLFERAHLDTVEHLPVIVYSVPTSPRDALLDSIVAGKLHIPQAVVVVGKDDVVEFLEVTAGSHDPSRADIVEFDVRVYSDYAKSRGAGTNSYYSAGRRIVDTVDLNAETRIAGPFSVSGPAVVEGWAKAAATGSYGWMEFTFKRRSK